MTVVEKMNKWVKKLEDAKLEYPADTIDGFVKELKDDGIILAYGMSDDLLEFSGVLNAECGAWKGITVQLVAYKDGKVTIFDAEENWETQELNRLQIGSLTKVQAYWRPQNEKGNMWALWHITLPDESFCGHFDIFEEGKLYCRGLIIPVESLTKVDA